MSKQTFGFNKDGQLVEVLGQRAFATNQIGPMPAVPSSLFELPAHHAGTHRPHEWCYGVSDIWMNDRLGTRTLSGILIQEQQAQNRIHNSILDMMKIHLNPHMPATVRRQFRFPRSKKKRIRKKWRKDQRNWRDENVMWLVNPSAFTRCEYPDGRSVIRPVSQNEKSNAFIHNFRLE